MSTKNPNAPEVHPLLWIIALFLAFAPALGGEDDRLQRALDWPEVDLEKYRTVFIEDVSVTDPMGPERKNQDLLKTVPARMANFISFSVDPDLFEEINRRPAEPGENGLTLRVELTQYKPGSAAARTFAWGGLCGGTRGITLMEENAAKEIAAWLSLGKGEDQDTILEKMKFVALQGPPEAEHGTIYILRPQGMVGAAVRFRVGIDDMTLGESKRKRYHVAYVTPGNHKVWAGNG